MQPFGTTPSELPTGRPGEIDRPRALAKPPPGLPKSSCWRANCDDFDDYDACDGSDYQHRRTQHGQHAQHKYQIADHATRGPGLLGRVTREIGAFPFVECGSHRVSTEDRGALKHNLNYISVIQITEICFSYGSGYPF